MPSLPKPGAPCIQATLRLLATRRCEKCGPGVCAVETVLLRKRINGPNPPGFSASSHRYAPHIRTNLASVLRFLATDVSIAQTPRGYHSVGRGEVAASLSRPPGGAGAAAVALASIWRSMSWQEPHSVPMPHRRRSLTERAPSSIASRTSRSDFARQRQTIKDGSFAQLRPYLNWPSLTTRRPLRFFPRSRFRGAPVGSTVELRLPAGRAEWS